MTERNHNPCVWKKDFGEDSLLIGVTWLAGCKEMHTFVLDGPKYNGFDFCPYCGGPIEEYEGEH